MDGAEAVVARLAAKQMGLITRAQCDDAGFSMARITQRVRKRLWRRVWRGLYLLGTGTLSERQRMMGALLVVGDGAAVSHQSAAKLLGLDVRPASRPQIIVPFERGASECRQFEVFRSRDLVPDDVFTLHPLRVTRLGRTILDLAGVLDQRWLRATIDSALRLRGSNLDEIRRALQSHARNHRGSARLRLLLDEYKAGAEIPDSVFESFAMELGLATGRKPHLHLVINGEHGFSPEVDLAWPEVRLAVELDGWEHHCSHAAFEKDRMRDRRLMALGWAVMRFTWTDVKAHRDGMIHEIQHEYVRRQNALRGASLRAAS